MKNENGFIMPLVVILALLFVATLFHQITQLESDRQFLIERENDFHHNSLLQMASVDILPILENIDTIENRNGQFQYNDGTVFYTILDNGPTTITVQLTSSTRQTGKKEVHFEYDKIHHGITNWTE